MIFIRSQTVAGCAGTVRTVQMPNSILEAFDKSLLNSFVQQRKWLKSMALTMTKNLKATGNVNGPNTMIVDHHKEQEDNLYKLITHTSGLIPIKFRIKKSKLKKSRKLILELGVLALASELAWLS